VTSDITTAQATTTTTGEHPLDAFADARNVLLTTYRRDGSPVGTPVHIAVAGDVGYIRTFAPSGKLARIRRNPKAEIAPCTVRGRVTGPGLGGIVRVLGGDEAALAASALAEKYPVLQGRVIPWYHRHRRLTTTHLAFAPE
jgi:PPOX class probable F420-dependent enzyme